MIAAGAAATCIAVKLDEGEWESALFFHLAGPECKGDRRALSKAPSPLPVGLEADLIENEHAAVVLLRLEVHTTPDNPLVAEVLLTPGHVTEQFDALKLLGTQPRLCWFFGDSDFNVIHSQQHPLGDEQRASFGGILQDAIKHDRLIRLTGRYDARAALSDVVSHYELREGVLRSEYQAADGTPRPVN